MKITRCFVLFLGLVCGIVLPAEVRTCAPAEAAQLVADGSAVLVDVREASEWVETGVAAPAVLLPKSAFDADRGGDWKSFLEKSRTKEIILYCRSGHRAGIVGSTLASLGYKVANAGGFKAWREAGLPVKVVAAATAAKKSAP